jgi:hypothetical protein
MKIKMTNRVINPNVQKRFKLIYTVFIALIGANYLCQYVNDAMMEELYGVNAADDGAEYEDPITNEDGVYFS